MASSNRTLEHKNKRKTAFQNETLKNITLGRRGEPIGLSRAFSSALAIMMGCLTAYTAVLYMLPIVSPKQVLGISRQNSAAAAMEQDREAWLRNTILRPFELRRTYLGKNQAIRAHYVIPEGTVVELKIEQCMRALIVEAYKCKVISTSSATLDQGMGTRLFRFNQVSFYQFSDQLRYVNGGGLVPESGKDGYRIIWVRD